jgi:beta-lactamase regulating signal transducer with metallopeptidase domain
MNAFWETVISNALLVAVLAVGVALLGRIWRNPLGLHLLWVLVLLKFVTPPLMTISVSLPLRQAVLASVEHEEEIATIAVNRHNQHTVEDRMIPSNTTPNNESVISASSAQQHGVSWLTIVAWAWGAGIVAVGFRQAYRVLRFLRLLHAAEVPSAAVLGMALETGKRLGLRNTPEICMLPVCISPLVWSVSGRAQVLLPVELFARLDVPAQHAILAHELAHVRRKDHWVRLLELFISTLFWWHPVVWWACRELQELEDQCCDAMVVGMVGHDLRAYATALLDTLDFLAEGSVTVPLGATATKSSVFLTRRIAMLKNRAGVTRLTFGRLVLLAIVAAVSMTVAFAAKPPKADAPADATRKPASAVKPANETVVNADSGTLSIAAKTPADATDREFKSLRLFIPIFAVDAIRYDSSGAKELGFCFGAKELGLSSQQEKELRAVFDAHDADMVKINKQIVKEMETLSPEERAAKQAEMGEKRTQQFKATRKRAEKLLTGEQRTKLNNIIVRKSASEGLLLIPQEREKIGLTEDQAKQLLRLREERDACLQEHFGSKPQLLREIAAQSLAILSPQQREKLAVYVDATPLLVQTIVTSVRSSDTSTVTYAGGATDGEPAMVGKFHVLAKELGLNAEQVTKLQAVSATYSTKLQELSDQIRKLPPNERKTKVAEHEQKGREIEKDARKEIEKVLAPQQLAALKKSILDDVAADALASSWMMKHLNASAEQERALRRLGGKKEETDKNDGQFFQEADAKYGDNSLKVLTPQQREKVEEEVERLGR